MTTGNLFVTYSTDDVEDYGIFEGHIDQEKEEMGTGLFILPGKINDMEIKKYHYELETLLLNTGFGLYTVIDYSEEEFQKEQERLKGITCMVDGKQQNIQYSDTLFEYPAYVAIYASNSSFEYALLDEENQSVIYVYSQFLSIFDFVPKQYIPLEYASEDEIEYSWDNVNIYYLEEETGDAFLFYRDGE